MKKNISVLISSIALIILSSCSHMQNKKGEEFEVIKAKVEKNLKNFDDLDFNVFTNQKWDQLHNSHHKNIKVYWPDGNFTVGIERHISDLKYLFTYAPDTRIETHPVKVGDINGEWTAVYGIMEGTFTKPMNFNGKIIKPNGKKFKLPMATIGHWTEEGVMDEEYLFWDNATYMKQLGLAN